MPFTYSRIVHFQDTDAAGVVYFANVLNICHEAYEASLAATGINLRAFFQGIPVPVPIVHAEVDFFQPLFCGDALAIHLIPKLPSGSGTGEDDSPSDSQFDIEYQIFTSTQKVAAQALTRHMCIDAMERKRRSLPPELRHWCDHWAIE